ncbi:MAG: class I SAM-dependent methyltransferase, partial [Sandaracinobacter sp.]
MTLREFVRHVMHRAGVLDALRQLRSGPVKRGEGATLEERFTYIYDKGVWQSMPDAPLSGAGSHPAVAGRLGLQLPEVVRELGVHTFLDVGCGDFSWMRDVDLGCQYIGVDIVADVIARNSAEHGNANRSFAVLNAVAETLPHSDMVLCREVLFHLSFADAKSVIRNVVRSGARWLLLTSDDVT